MRILTVQQPWAWAIVHGGKTVENRTQLWTYRGPLAIHAGSRWSDRGARIVPAHTEVDLPEVAMFGAVIGVVDLTDVHRSSHCCGPWGEFKYYGRQVVHLVLENPRPIDPVPAKGRLGLWHDVDVLAEVRRRLGAAA